MDSYSKEGWLIIHSELRNDDPWKHDDCWHEGPYKLFTIPALGISFKDRQGDELGACWDKIEAAIRSSGLTLQYEVTGIEAISRGYRLVGTVMSQAQLNELKRQVEEDSKIYAEAEACFGPDYGI